MNDSDVRHRLQKLPISCGSCVMWIVANDLDEEEEEEEEKEETETFKTETETFVETLYIRKNFKKLVKI